MKVTPVQFDRSLKKLARAYGYWNCPNVPNRHDADMKLWAAAWQVIRKSGHYKEYQREIKRAYKAFSRKAGE